MSTFQRLLDVSGCDAQGHVTLFCLFIWIEEETFFFLQETILDSRHLKKKSVLNAAADTCGAGRKFAEVVTRPQSGRVKAETLNILSSVYRTMKVDILAALCA